MTQRLAFLGLSGSLRERSYNTALLRDAAHLLPPNVRMEIGEIRDLPLYDEDVRQRGFPAPVQRLRDQIARADALVIATPEYNYSIPGVLKNAIDWSSRPPAQPFNEKPMAIMGASPGRLGTIRAQLHLRDMFVYLNAHIVNQPEVLIRECQNEFDENLRLTKDDTRKLVAQLLQALADWTVRLRAGAEVES